MHIQLFVIQHQLSISICVVKVSGPIDQYPMSALPQFDSEISSVVLYCECLFVGLFLVCLFFCFVETCFGILLLVICPSVSLLSNLHAVHAVAPNSHDCMEFRRITKPRRKIQILKMFVAKFFALALLRNLGGHVADTNARARVCACVCV